MEWLPCRVACLALFSILASCLLSVACGLSYEEASPDSLRQVHVLMRHGMRAPLQSYPGDPNNSEDLWPNGFGQLLQEGFQMHDRLGRWFRKRYNHLLDPYPNLSQIHVMSTDVDRVINSALANLAALFFVSNVTQRYKSDLPYTPVPVHTLPVADDRLLHVSVASCHAVTDHVAAMHKLPEVWHMTKLAEWQDLFTTLSTKLRVTVKDVWDIERVYDTFLVQEEAKLALASWAPPLMPLMKETSDFVFEMLAYTRELKILKGGPLVQKIIDDMNVKAHGTAVEGKSAPNFLMYSGHDATIAINLQTLGLYNHQRPPYASAVLYELHQRRDGEYYVKILYHNDSSMASRPHVLTLPGCSEECPLQQLHDLLKEVLPGSSQNLLCLGFYLSITDSSKYILVLFLIVILTTLVSLFILEAVKRRRERAERQPLLQGARGLY